MAEDELLDASGITRIYLHPIFITISICFASKEAFLTYQFLLSEAIDEVEFNQVSIVIVYLYINLILFATKQEIDSVMMPIYTLWKIGFMIWKYKVLIFRGWYYSSVVSLNISKKL